MNAVRPLDHAPAPVEAAVVDAEDRFPQFPADVAHPQRTVARVKAHLPRIAKAVGPDLRARAGRLDKWIVGRNGIGPVVGWVIDVDPHDARQKIVEPLAGLMGIGRHRRRGIAGGEIEHAVGAEVEVATVVTARRPGDDGFRGVSI